MNRKTGTNRKSAPVIWNEVANREVFSLKGTADFLGISQATLFRRIEDGTIKTIRLKGRTLVRRSAIEEALAAGEKK
jgi:predicted DNA-binding transcriptional regulator AlpA